MNIQKVTLIGLGAMGSFFAPKLDKQLGRGNFRLLADGERKERLETPGVTINGVTHRFAVVTPDTQGDPADLVIMAVKEMGLAQAIRDIKNQIGEHTQILCVMNGVDSEEQIAAVYGREHVLYSFMRVSIVMQNGVANYDPTMGSVHFGEAKNDTAKPTRRVSDICELFDACGIRYEIDPDMIKGQWFKYMCNVGENLTCALLRIPFGAYRVSDHANEIRRTAMREVIAVANKLGIALGEEDIERQEEIIVRLPFANKPSTLQDLENRRTTEVEMFAGKIVRLGRQLGVETPLSWMFYHAIKVLEESNRGLFEEPKN